MESVLFCVPVPSDRHQAGWSGQAPVPLPMLATGLQSLVYLAKAPSDEGVLKLLFGLVEHNLALMMDDIRDECR